MNAIDDILNKGFDVKMTNKLNNEDFNKYRDEAIDKYGQTAKDSYDKCDKHSKKYHQNIIDDMNDIFAEFANYMNLEVDHIKVQQLVKKWQYYITSNFYECTDEILSGFADLYVEDERFKKNIDKTKPGLAEYISKAVIYYCQIKKNKKK